MKTDLKHKKEKEDYNDPEKGKIKLNRIHRTHPYHNVIFFKSLLNAI